MAGRSIAQGGRVVGRGFKHAYELAGTNIVLSVLWFVFALMPVLLTSIVAVDLPGVNSIIIAIAALLMFFGPVTAMVYSIAYAAMRRETSGIFREVYSRLKTHFSDSIKVTAAMFAILAVLYVDLLFFSQSNTVWIQYISVFWLYLILFWALMFQYLYPVMVREQRKKRKVKVLEVLKMSALLALDNMVASFVILAAGVAFVWISLLFRVPVLLFLAGTLGFLHVTALDTIIKKYTEGKKDTGEDTEADKTEAAELDSSPGEAVHGHADDGEGAGTGVKEGSDVRVEGKNGD